MLAGRAEEEHYDTGMYEEEEELYDEFADDLDTRHRGVRSWSSSSPSGGAGDSGRNNLREGRKYKDGNGGKGGKRSAKAPWPNGARARRARHHLRHDLTRLVRPMLTTFGSASIHAADHHPWRGPMMTRPVRTRRATRTRIALRRTLAELRPGHYSQGRRRCLHLRE